MKYRAIILIVLVMLSLSVPVLAQEDDVPHVVFVGGTVDIEPFSSFVFNWTWWGLDEGNNLTFYYTTNNSSNPVYCTVNNSQYTLLEIYDYFLLYTWNRDSFPARADTWFFNFQNIANKTIRLEVAVTYDIPDDEPPSNFLMILLVVGVGAWVGTIVLLAVLHYVRIRRQRRYDSPAEVHGEIH